MLQNGVKNSLGVTELGRIIKATKGQIQGTTLQIPTVEYHTSSETTYKRSVDKMIEVLRKLYLN